jgi:hypothetical protein
MNVDGGAALGGPWKDFVNPLPKDKLRTLD